MVCLIHEGQALERKPFRCEAECPREKIVLRSGDHRAERRLCKQRKVFVDQITFKEIVQIPASPAMGAEKIPSSNFSTSPHHYH